MTETASDQDRTLTFPNVVAKRMAEAAIAESRTRNEVRRNLAGTLNLHLVGRSRIGDHFDFGGGSHVVEVIEGDAQPLWTVINAGRANFQRFHTLDEALLRAVELRNGGGPNDKGHIYAARMLGVGRPAEDAAR